MKTYLLQSFLLLFGITAAHGQVNLSDMPNDSSDSLQKSKIWYFSPCKGRKDRICSFLQRISENLTSLQRMILIVMDCVGTYILEINVNRKIYSEKVTL